MLEEERKEEEKQKSPWKLWRWIIFWYQMAFVFEITIFLVFWIFYGTEGAENKRETKMDSV